MVNIYLANLGAYNRGHLVGKQITLPMDEEKLQEEVDDVLNGEDAIRSRDFEGEVDEEFAIHDFETDLGIEISEYTGLYKLNEMLGELEFLDEYELTVVKAVLDAGIEKDIMKIIEEIGDYSVYPDIHDDSNLGHYYLDEEELPEYLTHYFDYSEYGRDSRINELGSFTDYGYTKKIY